MSAELSGPCRRLANPSRAPRRPHRIAFAVSDIPFDKWGELEQTYHFVEQYNPDLFRAKLDEATAERNKAQQMAADEGVKASEMVEDRDQRLAEQAQAAGKAGGRGRGADSQGVDNTLANSHGSSNIPYLVRRLKRDAPQIAEALGRGEYRSARAAGIAAGIVRRMDGANCRLAVELVTIGAE